MQQKRTEQRSSVLQKLASAGQSGFRSHAELKTRGTGSAEERKMSRFEGRDRSKNDSHFAKTRKLAVNDSGTQMTPSTAIESMARLVTLGDQHSPSVVKGEFILDLKTSTDPSEAMGDLSPSKRKSSQRGGNAAQRQEALADHNARLLAKSHERAAMKKDLALKQKARASRHQPHTQQNAVNLLGQNCLNHIYCNAEAESTQSVAKRLMCMLRANLHETYQLRATGRENVKQAEQVTKLCGRWILIDDIVGERDDQRTCAIQIKFFRAPDFKTKFEEKKVKALKLREKKEQKSQI